MDLLKKYSRWQEWLHGSNVERISFMVSALIVIWIAYQLAVLSWSFVAVPATTTLDASDQSMTDKSMVDQQAIAIDQLADWHLFGVATKQDASVKLQPTQDAPETRLKLVLMGVFSADTAAFARAIIADAKGNQLTYGIKEQLPGGAELSEIHTDRVILLRNGRPETLRLAKKSSKSLISRSPSPLKVRNNRQRSTKNLKPVDILKDYRASLTTNPRRLMELVQAVPETRGGQFIGFKLYPGRKPRLFGQLGLKRGDVVTSVNGVVMDSPEKGFSALNSLRESGTLDLIVLRKGQEVALSFADE